MIHVPERYWPRYTEALRALAGNPNYQLLIEVFDLAERELHAQLVEHGDDKVLRQLQGAAQLFAQLRQHRQQAQKT